MITMEHNHKIQA